MPEVTAVEAAKVTGRSERTIRRWIAKGTLPARQIAPNRYTIKLTDLKKITGHDSPDMSALVARIAQLEEVQEEAQKIQQATLETLSTNLQSL